MISDKERHKVARKLRETKQNCDQRESPWMVEDLMQALGFGSYEDGEEHIFDRLADLIDRPTGKVVSKCERDTRVPYRLGTDHYCKFEFDDEDVYFGDMVEVFWDDCDGERSCVGWLCSVDYGDDGFMCGAFLRDEDDDALFVPCDGVFYKPDEVTDAVSERVEAMDR